jgi:DNA-binding MarR family transcriptional regulator
LPSRIISLVVVIVAFVLTLILNVQALVELFLTTLGISSVLILVDIHWKVMTSRSAAVAAVVGTLTVFVWSIGGLTQATGLHVVWPALGLTLGIGVLGGFVTQSKYYARDEWAVEPSEGEVERSDDIDLSEEHLEILHSISTGGKRFADLLDTLQIASHRVNDFVEDLDRNRYIHRHGLNSHRFYKFELTEKGREALDDADIGPADEKLAEHNIDEVMRDTLDVIDENPGIIIDDIAVELDVTTTAIVPLVQRLLELDYVEGYGQIRQKLKLTSSGETVLRDVRGADADTTLGEATD